MSSLLLLFVAVISLYLLHELLPYLENYLTKSNFEERGFKDRFEYEIVRSGGFDTIEEFNTAKKYKIPDYNAFEESYHLIRRHGFPDYPTFKDKYSAFKKGRFRNYHEMRKGFIIGCDTRSRFHNVIRGGFKDFSQYKIANSAGIENIKQFREAYDFILDYGLSSYSDYQLFHNKIISGGFSSLKNFLYARSKGFSTACDQKNATKMGYASMDMFEKSLKFKIPNAIVYSECIDDLEKYEYPDYNTYMSHHSKMTSKGFTNYESYIRATQMGYREARDYVKSIRGNFESAEEYYEALKGGFTRSDIYKFVRKYGFSTYSEYLDFVYARKTEINRIKKYREEMTPGIRTPLIEMREQLAIDKATLIILLFTTIRKDPGFGELYAHEGVFIRTKIESETTNEANSISCKIGVITKTVVKYPIGLCPDCGEGDNIDIFISSLNEKPICPNCRRSLSMDNLILINCVEDMNEFRDLTQKLGIITKQPIKFPIGLCPHCNEVDNIKVFLDSLEINTRCPSCISPLSAKDLILINNIGVISGKKINGIATMHECGAVDLEKVFAEFAKLKPCPYCNIFIRKLVKIKI